MIAGLFGDHYQSVKKINTSWHIFNNRPVLPVQHYFRWTFAIALIFIFFWIITPESKLQLAITLCLLMTGIGSWVLHRRQKPVFSAMFSIIMVWLIVTVFAMVWPTIHLLMPVVYILCIFASLHVNDLFGIIILVLSAIVRTVFMFMGTRGWIDITLTISNPWLEALLYILLFAAAYTIIRSYNLTLSAANIQLTSFGRRYQALLNSSSDGVLLIDFDHRVVEANPRAAEMLGYTLAELVKLPLDTFYLDPQQEYQIIDDLLKGDQIPVTGKRYRTKNGDILDVEATMVLVVDEKGNPLCVQSILRDVTEKKRGERELSEARQRYQALFDNYNDAVFMIGFDYLLMVCNQKGADLLGYEIQEMIGQPMNKYLVIEDLKADRQLFNDFFEGKHIPIFERQLIHKDGHHITVELNIYRVDDEQGKPLYIHGVARDVSDKINIMNDLREYQQRYQALFDRTGEAILIVSPDLINLSANKQAYILLGYQPPELTGKPMADILCQQTDIDKMQQILDTLLAGDTVPRFVLQVCNELGEVVTVEVSSAMVYDAGGKALYSQHILRDITAQLFTEEHLKTSLSEMVVLAATDALTGLNNRRTILNYGENLLRRAKANNLPFSLALIDMDYLKFINDQYGHLVGDQALLHLSEIISRNMRATDMLGRWAGDEFLLLLPDTPPHDALAMASRLHEKIGSTPIPLPVGKPLNISASVGVAGVDQAHFIVNDMDQLMRWADQALYEAKAAGRNQVQMHLE